MPESPPHRGNRSLSPDEDKQRSDEREPMNDLSMDGNGGKENEDRSLAKVHVGCLTRNVTEAHVREIFETYGPLVSVELAIDKAVNIPLGFAYVEYERVEDAERAKKYMNGGQIDGNVVTVQYLDQDGASRRDVERREEQPREFRRDYGRRGSSPPPRRPYEPYRGRDSDRDRGRGRGRMGQGYGRGRRPLSPYRRQLPPYRRDSWHRSRSPNLRGRELSPWSRRQRLRNRSISRSRSRSRNRSRSRSRSMGRGRSPSRSRNRSRSRSRSRSQGRRRGRSPSRSYSSYTSDSRSYPSRGRSYSRSPMSSRSDRSRSR